MYSQNSGMPTGLKLAALLILFFSTISISAHAQELPISEKNISSTDAQYGDIERAYTAYMSALQMRDIRNDAVREERQKLLNEALSLYLRVAEKVPRGVLFANIGTIYFYLGDIGMSMMYLLRAEELSPRHQEIKETIQAVRRAADLTDKSLPPSWSDSISGKTYFSSSARNGLLIALLGCVFLITSVWIWLPYRGLKICTQMLSLLWGAAFFLIVLTPLFWGQERAVVMRTVFLKASQGEEDAGASSQGSMLVPGEEIEVLAKSSSEHWLRIRTSRGNIGYLSGDTVRILR